MLNESEWRKIKESMTIGSHVRATVTSHHPFGVLVIVNDKVWGVLERLQMARAGYSTPGDYPMVGATFDCQVLGHRDWSRQVEVGLPAKSVAVKFEADS